MDVPFRSYSQLKAEAMRTLAASQYCDRFPVAIELIVERDFEYPDECLDAICSELGRQFEVSRNVIQNRLLNKHEDFISRLY